MFQDEARFGRLPVIRRAWAPNGVRPNVKAAVQREYKYVYGAISPFEGELDWSVTDMMNTDNMRSFLQLVSEQHPDDYILMVLDGASSHTTEKLELPDNMRLLALPPYSPELNPVENLWNELRKKCCGNRYFKNLKEVVDEVVEGFRKMVSGGLEAKKKITSMFCWPWMQAAISSI